MRKVMTTNAPTTAVLIAKVPRYTLPQPYEPRSPALARAIRCVTTGRR